MTVQRYVVVAETPKGTFDLEVPTGQGPEVAGRRALFSLASAGYGDLDEIRIISITEGTFE